MKARIKRIEIIILAPPDNKRVIRRIRIVPPKANVKGYTWDKPEPTPSNEYTIRQYFTPDGAETALYNWIGKFDDAMPNHRYRLVPIGNYRFKLVWEQAGPIPGDREI